MFQVVLQTFEGFEVYRFTYFESAIAFITHTLSKVCMV